MNVEALIKAGGREWVKEGMHRIYFDTDELAAKVGFVVERFGISRSISRATLDGCAISNNNAILLLPDTFWYDVKTGDFSWRVGGSDKIAVRMTNFLREECGMSNLIQNQIGRSHEGQVTEPIRFFIKALIGRSELRTVGDTYPHRAALKAAGYRWDGEAWYVLVPNKQAVSRAFIAAIEAGWVMVQPDGKTPATQQEIEANLAKARAVLAECAA